MNIDEYAAMYKVEQDHWWYRGLRFVLLPLIVQKKPQKILDAGCGTGINMAILKQQQYSIEGIDASPQAIHFCKKRGLDKVQIAKLQKLPFKNQEFELIYCLDVLGILSPKEQDQALKEMRRCLKSGGMLVIHVAALQFLYSQHDVACHIKKRFYKTELRQLVQKNGFEVSRCSYRVFLFFPFLILVKFWEKFFLDSSAKGDLEKTNWLLNNLFTPFMWLESQLLSVLDLPWGSSLVLVAKKNP